MTQQPQQPLPSAFDDWITSLYKETFKFDFSGKEFIFKKRFPTGVAFSLQSLDQAQQLFKLVAILSHEPVISEQQAARLPQDFYQLFSEHLQQYFDFDNLKKALPPRP